MINGINSREMILEILLEIEEGEHSHVAIRNALSKYQFLPKHEPGIYYPGLRGNLRISDPDRLYYQFFFQGDCG